jgi:branched-chain amino acid transport system ATP-binding protein
LKDANQRTEDLLHQLGLGHKRHDLAMNLSYAEQRALELGVTLGSNSEVLLLDEPTAGMSRSETRHFIGLIDQLTRGKTLLLVEHDMGVVFELADKIAVLVHGQVMAFDTPRHVRENPQVQAAYLGTLSTGEVKHA